MSVPIEPKRNTNTSKRDRAKNKGMVEVEPTYGCRDFYPQEMRLQRWIFDNWREVARLYGFQEYDAPILESQELYQRKAGEEIVDQMFAFQTRDERLVALRPEMTPSLARMILRSGRSLLMPIRWYSIPQCWRFEVICRGRNREHYQWNMDILGVEDVAAEAELLSAIVTFFKRVGITSKEVGIKINSREVLHEVLTPLGVSDAQFAPVCVIVDKLDKLEEQEVVKQLAALNLLPEVIDKIKSTLTIKDLGELRKILPGSRVLEQFERLWELAVAYGYEDWIQFDASVVRGLAYYTGIVFEGFDRSGKLRAICGGGRYNRLLTTYGAKEDIPACGFGFGDCVILELLKDRNLLPALPPSLDDLVVVYNEQLRPAACQVAAKLRGKGRSVDVVLIPNKKVAWSFNYADRIGANRAIFVAPDEWSRGEVRIKELRKDKDDLQKEYNVLFTEL
eukprot:TRINITY_DN8141_c0_g2_i1.p1 TRINITY_DN8141_c0_g2~~TRINITY_DN8141_c0_g2_i1.p1  ORF type:complete len:477 (+),score=109.64 TRINITY_DN8141_c0_g2_i1:83-1432(+)